jgi:membrane-bound lytic murein transglycosylase D
MLTRALALGLVALLLGACAHVPQEPADALAGAKPPVTKTAAPKEQPPTPPVDIQAQTPPSAPVVQAPPPPPPPPPPPNVWDRIRAGFRMANLDGVLVERQEQWYADNPEYVARMVERSSLFLYHVVEEVERRNMPTEIALLPMIESAYNPTAYSRSHAAGMWQFIPSTGRLYGLRQNFWYDGRRDVLSSTSAALDYLQKLHDQFGDWSLALAAYNWGEGAVSRAVARNEARGLPTDYESLPMPLETRKYVPKLQAVKNIVSDSRRYGVTLPDIPNRPYFATVISRRHIDVELAASLAEMSPEEFRFLNPAHNKPVIKADGSEAIVLPVDKVAVFEKNLETHDQPLVSWQAYTVKRSDRPERIASKHGMTLAQLKEVNGIPPRRNIVAGQTVLVPSRGDAEPHLPDLPAPRLATRRYKRKSAYCYVASDSGAKKRVPCAAPAKKKNVSAKQPAVRRVNGSRPEASTRSLTGG